MVVSWDEYDLASISSKEIVSKSSDSIDELIASLKSGTKS